MKDKELSELIKKMSSQDIEEMLKGTPSLTEQEKKKIYNKSMKKLKAMSADDPGEIVEQVEGVDVYTRPLISRIMGIAAAAVLVIVGIGGGIFQLSRHIGPGPSDNDSQVYTALVTADNTEASGSENDSSSNAKISETTVQDDELITIPFTEAYSEPETAFETAASSEPFTEYEEEETVSTAEYQDGVFDEGDADPHRSDMTELLYAYDEMLRLYSSDVRKSFPTEVEFDGVSYYCVTDFYDHYFSSTGDIAEFMRIWATDHFIYATGFDEIYDTYIDYDGRVYTKDIVTDNLWYLASDAPAQAVLISETEDTLVFTAPTADTIGNQSTATFQAVLEDGCWKLNDIY